MKANTDPSGWPQRSAPAITVHALKSNKRPIRFAPWPDPPKKKRAPRKKPSA